MQPTENEPTSRAAPVGPAPLRQLGYRRELDGLRGIAVAMVVVYHVGGVLWRSAGTWLLPAGGLGVDLFFVLSGFLITSLLLGEHQRRGAVDLQAFARRRTLRLVPAMAGLLAVVLAVAATTGRYAVGDVLSTAGWSLAFTSNWAIVDGRTHVLGHLWSVAVEGQFYLVWAVAVAVALRLRRAVPVLAAVASAGVLAVMWWRASQLTAGANPFMLYLGTSSRLDAPLVGALAGLALTTGRLDRLGRRGAAALTAGGLSVLLVSAVALRLLDPILYRGLFTVVALAGACAVVGALRAGDGVLRGVLGARPLVSAGKVSYSLYLWHLPIFEWLAEATPGWPPLLRTAAGVVAALAAAIVSYRVVELPFLRRRHRSVGMAKQRSSRSPNAYAS